MARYNIQASLTVPIMGEEKEIGLMIIASIEPRTWSSEEISLGIAVSHQLGAAVERLELLEKTREQALQLREILDIVHEGIISIDSDGQVILANSAAREFMALLTDADEGEVIRSLGERPIQEFLTAEGGNLPHEITFQGPPKRCFEISVNPAYITSKSGNWVLLIQEIRAMEPEKIIVNG